MPTKEGQSDWLKKIFGGDDSFAMIPKVAAAEMLHEFLLHDLTSRVSETNLEELQAIIEENLTPQEIEAITNHHRSQNPHEFN